MKKVSFLFLLFSCITVNAHAQTTGYSVGVFASTVTDANTATPVVAPITYPIALVTCGLAKTTVTGVPINPTTARFDDPADATKDCSINVTNQIKALPAAIGYKSAAQTLEGTVASIWSNLSNPFDKKPIPVTGLRIQ